MAGLDEIEARLAPHSLAVFGGVHPGPDDGAPEGCATLLLLGPDEPGFWAHVTAEPEFADGRPDPLDRWSRRVIGRLACDLGAKALFPFGGPPWRPFLAWATRSGRAWVSPVGLLVHDRAGLMVSYRGALALRGRLDLPAPPPAPPCDGCARPCVTACPVGALTPAGYDVGACHAFLDTGAGRECLDRGCRARRACPVSAGYGRRTEQSAFHMRSFHP
ncbi:ferredoxin [Roseicyclus persicicus]|uniref:Ferredoxin n=1 Tax=Roseicyclus persicicus TaxID=2650661 RepID=A0A7X6JY24_9RHOB|nr:ferredoxin [Roseibacterium persicicum]NKX45375.1 ferredoxin [Roseibacterium persicicum]